MIKTPLSLNLDKVVIGSSLEAVLFAFYGKHKLIFSIRDKPHQLDTMEDFGLGTDKIAAWNKYMFYLNLAGYVPFDEKVKHIKYIDENTIKVVTHEESVVKVNFNKLYIFDDRNILDLPAIAHDVTSDKVRIVDWFYVERGCIHDHELVNNDSNFMNQVIFFKDNRKSTAKRKDVCVVSYCNKKDLEEYPEHLVKIKTEKLMRDLGIETATPFRTYIKIDHIFREVTDYGKNVYTNFDNVEFVYHDLKFIYDINQRRRKIDYMKYLSMKLGI